MKLEKDDIAAMKQADRIAIHLTKNPKYPKATGSTYQMTLIQEKGSRVFGAWERTRIIDGDATLPGFANKAFVLIYQYQPNRGAWGVLVKLIRPGDELVLTARENGNQYVESAVIPAGKMEHHVAGYDRLHSDEMLITVRRDNKTVISELELYHSTCPANSARMIQV